MNECSTTPMRKKITSLCLSFASHHHVHHGLERHVVGGLQVELGQDGVDPGHHVLQVPVVGVVPLQPGHHALVVARGEVGEVLLAGVPGNL